MCTDVIYTGVGVFAGYYGRSDLTAQVLIDIDCEKCYKTGDLARLDVISGEVIFIGRRDHQVKLRGQRIELSAIELLILQSSSNIVNCIVMTEDLNDDTYLVAYVQVKKYTENANIRDEIIINCSCHLASYMIPTKWLFVPELPLNDNGKIDRKKLRQTATIVDLPLSDRTIKTLSSIELKLQDIFMRAFGLIVPPDVRTPFGQLGGTSLGAMRALNLIRQEVTKKMDIGLLFANPSVEALAAALEPIVLIAECENQEQEKDNEDFSIRPRPSWLIESLGILLLVWQWVWPIFMVVRLQFGFLPMLLVPLIHLIQFPMFLKLFGGPFGRGRDALYSWRYYRLWFLRRQWSLNTYWLAHLVGTPFYNAYLCLCGARISNGAYIYTTHIDAPWLLKVGSCTYISDEVILSSLTYHDCIYELHEILIGSYCSIGTRCVLHDRVDMNNGVLIEPLTAVTGRIIGQHQEKSSSHTLTRGQSQFQLVTILTALSIHMVTLKVSWSATNWLPVYIGLPIGWLMWVILGTSIGLLLLSLVGHVQQNFSHPLNSWEFLHKFWLRHLILNSFGWYISSVLDEMNWFIPPILRWLGVTIGDNDIHVTEIVPLLSVPPNLLTIQYGVTITSFVRFVPYDVTTNGQCIVVGPIEIGRESFIGNTSVLRSGVCLSEKVLIGSLTRIDSTINSAQKG
jgi:carbonic anhydrase/acetyltransferase-like protein (isoleucine patch superfamily)